MSDAQRVLVIVSSYNERDNLPRIVPLILEQRDAFHVLVVDDNSPDGTGDVADELAGTHERVQVLHHTSQQAVEEVVAGAADRGSGNWRMIRAL